MTLDMFHKDEKNVEAKPKVEWDGRDFRGDKVNPQGIELLRKYPALFEWLETKSALYINTACCYFNQFMEWSKMSIDEWLDLDVKKARDLVWQYIRTFRLEHPAKARIFKGFAKKFYLIHNEKALPFIPGKHDITLEPKLRKHKMTKEVCWKIIRKANSLRDETILIFTYESGLRRNAIAHMTYGHYKKFKWFLKDGDAVIPSDEEHGNIALFEVRAIPSKDSTHDNKLRGKGINWYYGCLHIEATELLKKYVNEYHQDSDIDTSFWYSKAKRWFKIQGKKGLDPMSFYRIIKSCIKRAGLPTKQINFHALRRGFRSVVRNTSEITDAEFKEAIMGHKLRSSQEAYFDKDPLEFAREYAKCDFSPPHPDKEKEIERLREQVKALSEKRVVETKKELVIPDGPLGGPRMEQPIKSEPVKPSEPLPKPLIAKAQIEQPSAQTDEYFTCKLDNKAYKLIDLPCIANPLFRCQNKLCEKQVMTLIR